MVDGPMIALFLVVPAIGVGLFIYSHYYSRDAITRRTLAQAPKRAVAEATHGQLVRLGGRAQLFQESLQAPLSGRPCVHYLLVVEEYRSSGKSGRWVEVIREEVSVDFLLRDASGAARVRMGGARVDIARDRSARSGTFDDATPIEAAILERHNIDKTTFFGFNRKHRYHEGVLELDENVTVLGVAQPGADAHRVVIDAPPSSQVLVSDDPDTVRAGSSART